MNKQSCEKHLERTFVEIDINIAKDNIAYFKTKNPQKKIIAVLKANAYGHGAKFAKYIQSEIDCIGVATLEEGILIRNFCKDLPILVFGYIPNEKLKKAVENNISISIYSLSQAIQIAKRSEKFSKQISAHIKINTGMERLGFLPKKEYLAPLAFLIGKINIVGVFSHYATTKETDIDFFNLQTQRFLYAKNCLEEIGFTFDFIHIANSAAAQSAAAGNAVRIGYGLYGYGVKGVSPILSWKACVAQISTIQAGETVSYDRTFTAKKTTRIATICAGYGDGFPRSQSNIGSVLYKDKILPIVGRICMDMFMIDATNSSLSAGDFVTLIGKQESNSILAEDIGFGYEILCGISLRVPRYYLT